MLEEVVDVATGTARCDPDVKGPGFDELAQSIDGLADNFEAVELILESGRSGNVLSGTGNSDEKAENSVKETKFVSLGGRQVLAVDNALRGEALKPLWQLVDGGGCV